MKNISKGYLPLVLFVCLLQPQQVFGTISWMVTDIRELANGLVYEQEPRFNFDGTLVAYRGLYAAGPANSDIWVVARDGLNGTPVVTEEEGEYNPCFAPDGRITYTKYLGGTDDIWILDRDGRGHQLFIDGPYEQISGSWHPTGQTFAYANEYESERSQICIADSAGNPLGCCTGPADGYAQSSPIYSRSGDRIAYANFTTPGAPEAWVMDDCGDNKQYLAEGAPMFWWPDDSRLVTYK